MNNEYVQVPVSLINRLGDAYLGDGTEEFDRLLRELNALLSQPNPTAEFQPAPNGWSTFGSHVGYEGPLEFSEEKDEAGDPLWERRRTAPAEPPRIEDLAPGTTFVHPELWTVIKSGTADAYARSGQNARYLEVFDPSTVRDVTPPKEAA